MQPISHAAAVVAAAAAPRNRGTSKQCDLRCDAGLGTTAQPAAAWYWVWIMLVRRPETQAEVLDLGGMREGAGSGSADHGWPFRELSSSGDLVKVWRKISEEI